MSEIVNLRGFEDGVVADTVTTLRKIRASVFQSLARPLPTVKYAEALMDAEKLALVSVSILIDGLPENSTAEEFEESRAVIDVVKHKYRDYLSFSFREEPVDLYYYWIRRSYLRSFRRHRQISGSNMENLRGLSNILAVPNLNLFNDRLGLLSPLSNDYFTTALLHRCLQTNSTNPHFKLKPIIIGIPDIGGRGNPQLPEVGDAYQEFQNEVDEIAVSTDADSGMAYTRKTVTLLAAQLFPGKIIHGAVF